MHHTKVHSGTSNRAENDGCHPHDNGSKFASEEDDEGDGGEWDDDDFTPTPLDISASSLNAAAEESPVSQPSEQVNDDWHESRREESDARGLGDQVLNGGKGQLLKGTSAQAILSLNTPAR